MDGWWGMQEAFRGTAGEPELSNCCWTSAQSLLPHRSTLTVICTHTHTHDTEHCRTKYRITLHTEAFWNLLHVPAAVDYFLHWSFCRVGLWNVRKWWKTCGSVFPQNQNWRLQMSCLVHSSKRKERNQEVFTLEQPEPENPDFFL